MVISPRPEEFWQFTIEKSIGFKIVNLKKPPPPFFESATSDLNILIPSSLYIKNLLCNVRYSPRPEEKMHVQL